MILPPLQMQYQQLPSQTLAHKLLFVDGSDHAQPPLFVQSAEFVQCTVFCIFYRGYYNMKRKLCK